MKKETHDSKDDVFDSELIEQRMHNIDIESEMKKSFLDYSMSVIVSRALPDVRDGLKPVHRRILYTLHENGLTPDKAYRKCADTVGSAVSYTHLDVYKRQSPRSRSRCLRTCAPTGGRTSAAG